MGLLDNLFSDDPKQQALLQMAMGLLNPQGGKNFGANVGYGVQQGLLGYAGAKSQQAKLAEEAQQKQLRDMQIAQMQRDQEQRMAMDTAAKRNFTPGLPQMQPTDYETPSGPQGPSSFNTQGYVRDLMGTGSQGVQQAVALQQAMLKDPLFGKVDPKDYTPESVAAFAKSGNHAVLVPVRKNEIVDGVAVDPYNIKPGSLVAGPQSQVVPDGRGGFQYNPARVNPLDRARLGIEAGRYQYETGQPTPGMGFVTPSMQRPQGAPQVGQQGPQIDPALAGLPPKQQAAVRAAIATKAGEQRATAQVTAEQQVPGLEATTKYTIGLVDQLVNHPGFSTTVGVKGPTGAFAAAGHPIAGTDAADWVALRDQVVGRQFLQAYETLKGAGQITEVEGKKATAAVARMQTSQSEASFKQAATEFKEVMQGALDRMKQRAGGTAGGASGGWSGRQLP